MNDMERRIYSPWAFSKNEREKGRINREIFAELMEKHKVFRHDLKIDLTDGVDCNFSDYDVIIGRKPGYNHAVYRIYKNAPGLTTAELALLCDEGNLCFGYSMQGDHIRVSED